jgi:4-amino-4-deoxy-L-arabinose transferase-like glycosyltransferase
MPGAWVRDHRRELLMGLILLVSLALRLASLHSFLTIDEQLWALRARRFAQALRTGNLAGTYQTHHPGVVTMWLGTASIVLGMASEGDLAGIVFGARWLVALVNWAGLGLMCLLIARLFGRRVALVAALLIGLDPFTLALSRLLHLDALLTTFATLSLLALLLHLRGPRSELRWLLLSALCTALALLSKSPGLFLVPFGAVLILAWGLRERRGLRAGWRLLLWSFVVALVVLTLWPALWVAPGATLARVWEGVRGQGLSPHENENFFLGHPTADPGPLFYHVAWLFRTTPWVLLGLAVFLLALWPPWASLPSPGGDHRALVGALVLFILLFSVLMTLGAKKFDRYLLPIFPMMGLVAARGLVRLGQRMRGHYQPIGLAVLTMVQLALTLPHHPYYLSYYNPVAGGALLAPRTLLVGWGEGMEQAAAYLNAKEDGPELRVTAWYQPPLAPFLQGEASVLSDADYSTDYFVFYINELQRDPSRAQRYCLPKALEKVIRAKGIDYAWICSTDQARQPLIDYLQEHVASQDLILLSRPAPRLEPRLPQGGLVTGDDALSTLRQRDGAKGKLWYVHEPYEAKPLRELDQQVGARCRKLEEVQLPLADVWVHELPPLSSFSPFQLDRPQDVDFDQELRLLRAGLIAAQLDFRQQVGVTLEWFSPADLQRDLKIAWRVRDARGGSWGGLDRLIVDEDSGRTSHWQAGTHHLTRHLIPLLPGLPPGPYSLDLTLYHEPTMEQLPYRESGGAWRPASYALADLEVMPCPVPPRLEELAIPESRRESLAEGLILLGLTPWTGSVRPGEDLPVELFWEAAGGDRGDWAVKLHLQDAAGQEVASMTETVAGSEYPTSDWPGGERIRARYQLPIPASTDPDTYSLLLSPVDGAPDASQVPEPLPLGQVVIQGRAHQFVLPEIEHHQEALLGQEVTLLGYDLTTTELSPGEELEVTLYWRARGEMSTSYTVFVHLLDRAERIWGQKDSLPGEGAWPTTSWVPGEVLADRYDLQVQQDAPSGEYRLEVGMYEAAKGDRRPVFDPLGERVPGDRILLNEPITIQH